MFFKWSLLFKFPHQNPLQISLVPICATLWNCYLWELIFPASSNTNIPMSVHNSSVSEIKSDAYQEDALWYSVGIFTRVLYGVKDSWSHSSTRRLTSCAVVCILHILPMYTSSSHYSRRKWNTSAKLAFKSTSKWRASTLQNCLRPTAGLGDSKTPTFQRKQ
jgi:hypothetical protein